MFGLFLKQVYDHFVARVTELTRKLRQGPVLGKETVDCGAMVMPAQLDIVQVQHLHDMHGCICGVLRCLLRSVCFKIKSWCFVLRLCG